MNPFEYNTFWERIFDAVNGKSDRDSVIVIVSWIDHLLTLKIAAQPTANARSPRHLAQRIDTAFTSGWIDVELRDDLHKLRLVRNEFAHSVEVASLSDETIQQYLAALRIPARQYYDWDAVGAVAMPDGSVVIYSGERPSDAVENLRIGAIRFKIGLAVIFSLLVASLEIKFTINNFDLFIATVPPHLRTPSTEELPVSDEMEEHRL